MERQREICARQRPSVTTPRRNTGARGASPGQLGLAAQLCTRDARLPHPCGARQGHDPNAEALREPLGAGPRAGLGSQPQSRRLGRPSRIPGRVPCPLHSLILEGRGRASCLGAPACPGAEAPRARGGGTARARGQPGRSPCTRSPSGTAG